MKSQKIGLVNYNKNLITYSEICKFSSIYE